MIECLEKSIRYKDCDITVCRDAEDDYWYIVVTLPDGTNGYDGWWYGSAHRSADDVIEEAKKRAMLDEVPDEPEAENEKCESGLEDCGPVEHWDSEAVPLCGRCYGELLNESVPVVTRNEVASEVSRG